MDPAFTIPKPERLDITCTSSNCDNALHCFRSTKKRANGLRNGPCRSCGADLISWPRLQQRDMTDVAHTLASLKQELIRHHFWHTPFDETALNHARRKGKVGLRDAARQRICQSVGPAKPVRDGRQTQFEGNVLYYAQHATASCCRKCIAEWHGIPEGQALTDEQIDYLTQLVLCYVDERLPDLPETGEYVPRRRRARAE
jgi:hypothetical protein